MFWCLLEVWGLMIFGVVDLIEIDVWCNCCDFARL